MSSKLLGSHSPSMLSPFKMSLAKWDSARLRTRRMRPYAGVRSTAAKCLPAIAIHHMGVSPSCACFVTFLHMNFSSTPQFDLEPDYIIRKLIDHRILWHIWRREILSTFHTWVDNRSIHHFCIVFTPKLPLPLRRSPPKSHTPIPSPTPLTTPNGIQIQSPVSPLLTSANRQMAMINVPYQ